MNRRQFIERSVTAGMGLSLGSRLVEAAPAKTTQLDADGFFTLGRVDGRWLLITPEGKPFFTLGMNHIDPATLRYPENIHIWRNKYDIGSAALDYSVRYFKEAQLGMAVTTYTNFTKISNKTLKFIHHMVEDSTGDVIMDIEIVAVLFDLKKRKSIVVPEDFRAKASKLLIDN